MPASAEIRIEVVEGNPDKIEQVRSLFLEYANSLNFSLCFQSFDEEVKNLPAAYGPPEGRLLLATVANQPAGCIALRPFAEGTCEMKRLYVRPAFRGQRIGQILTDRIIAEARIAGYERMRLDTVASSMQEAIKLYRKIGFREIAAYRNNPIEGAVYMELAL